jgi:hypothetical protein
LRFAYAIPKFAILKRSHPMNKLLAIGLAAALVLPGAVSLPQPAAAQDPVAGALLGGLLGAGVGAAVGGRRGAVTGAVIGGVTGAVLGSQIAPGYAGYFWGNDGRCYYQYPNGQVARAPRAYCG